MIPIRDTLRPTRPPLAVMGLVLINVSLFVYEVFLEDTTGARGLEDWIYDWALVPVALTQHGGAHEWLTLFTSMFLHGGLFHVAGNMLYLWVFGKSVEARFGHARFLAFYIACGLAAAGAQLFAAPRLAVPVLGASGAIAGILGAYLVFFPRARILTLVPFFFFFTFLEVPALLFIALWVILQNVFPVAVLPHHAEQATGGVAYWAHIGGFGAGAVIAWTIRDRLRRRPRIEAPRS